MTEEASFEELLAQHDAANKRLQAGQKITGTIIEISGDSVFVDVGLKEDGVLDRAEILDAEGNEKESVGDKIEAWVTNISPQGIRLSRSMTGSGVGAIEEARDSGIPVEGRVKGPIKGGYAVELMGKQAFCPGSQMENFPEGTDISGMRLQFLVTKVENRGQNIVVSRRALLDREKKANLDKILAELNIGDIVEGQISRIVPFGAFVELAPHVEGLIHISELGWSRVESPDEMVSIGDPVRAKVVSIVEDEKGQTRIGLSMKQATGDPWLEIGERFKPGDVVEGIVRRLAPFGAFIEIAPGIEGMAHISELSWEKRVTKPEEVLASGDKVHVKIKEIAPDARRISLSVRDAAGNPWETLGEEIAPGAIIHGVVTGTGPHGVFVQISPGVTALLPQSALNGPAASKVARFSTGDEIDAQIKSIDRAARRISLQLVSDLEPEREKNDNWRQHLRSESSDNAAGLNIMAQALAKAMQKK